jgi:hypothetical protein
MVLQFIHLLPSSTALKWEIRVSHPFKIPSYTALLPASAISFFDGPYAPFSGLTSVRGRIELSKFNQSD